VREADLESVAENASSDLSDLPGGEEEVEHQLAALEADLHKG